MQQSFTSIIFFPKYQTNKRVKYLVGLSLLILLFVINPVLGFSQIQHEGTPLSFQSILLKSTTKSEHMLAAVNRNEMMALDAKEGIDNRFGIVEDLNLDLKKAGTYVELKGYGVWVLTLSCETAQSIGVCLNTFDIPTGARLFVYSSDKKIVRGAFTSDNNKDGGSFALAEIVGQDCVIEYNEPLDAEFEGGVIIGQVAKSYLGLEERALPARVGINCPDGLEFQQEKRAVARMCFFSGRYSYWCSGSLINNTDNDGTPYFLTANHCISTKEEAATLITYFNYENSSCSSNDASEKQTISGASLKATSTYTDFALLELNEMPLESYQPYFLGWDVSGKTPTGGTAIHHPQGTPKCISIDKDPLVSYDDYINWDDAMLSDPDTHWQSTYEIGADEGGSSGSPILNQNHCIVGQLHGGNDEISLWGKLSLSWDSQAGSNRQLKYWLDAEEAGLNTLAGLDYYADPLPEFTITPNPACVNSLVKLRHVSVSKNVNREWTITPNTYSFKEGYDANSDFPQVYFEKAGSYTISCILRKDDFSTSWLISLEVMDEIHVELVDMPDELEICGRELNNFMIEADGAVNYTFEIEANEYFDTITEDNALILTLNDKGQQACSFDTYVCVTGSIGGCTDSDTMLLRVTAPINDNVKGAIPLRTGVNDGYTNVCGSVEEDEPYPSPTSCADPNTWCPSENKNPLDNSVWFTFVSPDNGYVEIAVSGIENQFAVYTGKSSNDILTPKFDTPTLSAAADTLMGMETKAILNLDKGINYYLQVDGKNGDEGSFSVEIKNNTIGVFPTASTDGHIRLVLPNMTVGRATISIYSIIGSKVFETTADIDKYQSTYQYDWSFLKPAMYIVDVEIDGTHYTTKFLIVA